METSVGKGVPRLPALRQGQPHVAGSAGSSGRRSTGPARFADPLESDRIRQQFDLVDRTTAFNHIHRPAPWPIREPARRRLAFDELFRLQLALVLRQERLQRDARGIRHVVEAPRRPRPSSIDSSGNLPFQPTRAQRRRITAIRGRPGRPLPMHRLLQGDVGSGKTVVAVAAMLAVEGGHQAALMAPTEVLAEQHAVRGHQPWSTDSPSPTRPRSKATSPAGCCCSPTGPGRRAGHASTPGLADGTVDLLIGTHALLTDQVAFRSLGVVVIDEQHRFGVEQRAALRAKGRGDTGPVMIPICWS
jgi:ATP-dependent DNA helicase RecG